MTNKNHTVFYTGVTTNLHQRVLQHKNGRYSTSFTNKYNIRKLVWFQQLQTIQEGIIQEKKVKNYSKIKKNMLITQMNPGWDDLGATIG